MSSPTQRVRLQIPAPSNDYFLDHSEEESQTPRTEVVVPGGIQRVAEEDLALVEEDDEVTGSKGLLCNILEHSASQRSKASGGRTPGGARDSPSSLLQLGSPKGSEALLSQFKSSSLNSLPAPPTESQALERRQSNAGVASVEVDELADFIEERLSVSSKSSMSSAGKEVAPRLSARRVHIEEAERLLLDDSSSSSSDDEDDEAEEDDEYHVGTEEVIRTFSEASSAATPKNYAMRSGSWIGFGCNPDSTEKEPRQIVRIANDDLQEAALRADLPLLRDLLGRGASVNSPIKPESEKEYMTLLHILCCMPQLPQGTKVIKQVLKAKANLNTRTSFGTTALCFACLHKHLGAMKLLLEFGADASPADDFGQTAVRACLLPPKNEVRDYDWEPKVLPALQLLAAAGINMNNGGERPPIVEAIRTGHTDAVRLLLASKAEPVGLCEAVHQKDAMDLIKMLVEAEANPFLKDSNGQSVMDLALAKGSEDMRSYLREYIADLQRRQHPHVKTLEEQMRLEALAEAEKVLVGGGRHRGDPGCKRSTAAASQVQAALDEVWYVKRRRQLQEACASVNKSQAFQVTMFLVLIVALFVPDIWVLLQLDFVSMLDTFIVIVLVCFIGEFFVQLIAAPRNYAFSFFFWMDLLGLSSCPLDFSVVSDAINDSSDNPVLVKTARVAKLAARAGRFTKLVKLLRFLPGFQQNAGGGTTKVIANTLNMALSIRVSVLIIVIVVVLPLFNLEAYPAADYSMQMWMDYIVKTAADGANSSVNLEALLLDFDTFYQNLKYSPFEIQLNLPNGSKLSALDVGVPLSAYPPTTSHFKTIVKIKAYDGLSYASFNFQSLRVVDSICNITQILTVMFLMIGSAILLSNSTQHLVADPLELLLDNVRRIASNIFNSVAAMAGKKEIKEADIQGAAREDDDAATGFGDEITLLEKVLKKILALSEIGVRKGGASEEVLEQMGEGDRAYVQGFTDTMDLLQDLRQTAQKYEEEEGEVDDISHLLAQNLAKAGILMKQFDDMTFDVLQLGQEAQRVLCQNIVICHRGRMGAYAVEWLASCNRFLDTLEKQHEHSRSRNAVYHTWNHAVDTAFMLHNLMPLCCADRYLQPFEGLGLIVAALAHDVAHPGFSNSFAVETSHELAIRYNDISPLESFHCARLFDIVRQPGLNIFLEVGQYHLPELRQMIVEAIINTDPARAVDVARELVFIGQTNKEPVGLVGDMYRTNTMNDFPSKEYVSFLQGDKVSHALRASLLHLADISNNMKPFNVASLWAKALADEMFNEGDVRKDMGLPVPPLYDRKLSCSAYIQLQLADTILPTVNAIAELMPPVQVYRCHMLEVIEGFFAEWEEGETEPTSKEKAEMKQRLEKLENK